MKNILGIEVTKPNQELIIMRGISGSGKSTRAKQMLDKESMICSTDDLIEAAGDYNLFFQTMIEKNDFSELHKFHKMNLTNTKMAMNLGVKRIIIDNTHIAPWEAKESVMYALNNGYADENIIIVDIGTGGLTAEQLFERNIHGVPLNVIEAKIQSHAAHSPLTLEKVINSKNPYENKVLYSAVVLDKESKNKLLNKFYDSNNLPEDITIFAHHMTIIFGKELPEHLKEDLGKEIKLVATHVGLSDTNLAVKVEGYYSSNKVSHITVAVKSGGKPAMSGDIENWVEMDEKIELKGVVKEITRN